METLKNILLRFAPDIKVDLHTPLWREIKTNKEIKDGVSEKILNTNVTRWKLRDDNILEIDME